MAFGEKNADLELCEKKIDKFKSRFIFFKMQLILPKMLKSAKYCVSICHSSNWEPSAHKL